MPVSSVSVRQSSCIIGRRDLLGFLVTAAWTAHPSIARELANARGMVGAGAIGPVRFCRAAGPRWVAAARQVCGNSALIVELDATASGAVLLGSTATLVLDRKGCRLLP